MPLCYVNRADLQRLLGLSEARSRDAGPHEERDDGASRRSLGLAFFSTARNFFPQRKKFQLRRGTGPFPRARRASPPAERTLMIAVYLRAVAEGGSGGIPGVMRASDVLRGARQPCRCRRCRRLGACASPLIPPEAFPRVLAHALLQPVRGHAPGCLFDLRSKFEAIGSDNREKSLPNQPALFRSDLEQRLFVRALLLGPYRLSTPPWRSHFFPPSSSPS